MKRTREDVVNMAWKAEGLDKILESQGQRVDLRDINEAYNIALLSPHPGINPAKVQREIEWAYKILDTLTQCYNYDSRKRKFNDDSTKGMKEIITKEDLIEIMLKAEGLSGILREKGHSAEEVEFTEAMLTNHRLFTGIIDSTREQKEIEWAYKTLYTLTKHYNYDSGRKIQSKK